MDWMSWLKMYKMKENYPLLMDRIQFTFIDTLFILLLMSVMIKA